MLKLEQLAELLENNRAAASARVKEFSIGGRPFAFNSQPAKRARRFESNCPA